MCDNRRAQIEDAAAAKSDLTTPATASYRDVFEVQKAGLADVEHTEERGGGRSLDDGVPGTKSPNRQRAGNGRKAIRSVRVVVDCRQGESACPQADEIAFAVRIRRVDGRDQARYIPGRTDE